MSGVDPLFSRRDMGEIPPPPRMPSLDPPVCPCASCEGRPSVGGPIVFVLFGGVLGFVLACAYLL
jgi:hypothetical protein